MKDLQHLIVDVISDAKALTLEEIGLAIAMGLYDREGGQVTNILKLASEIAEQSGEAVEVVQKNGGFIY